MTPDPNGASPHQVHPAAPRDTKTNLNRTPGGAGGSGGGSRGRAFQRAREVATRGSAIRHLAPGSRPSRVPANLRPQGVGRVGGGAAGAARDPERWCPWVGSMPPSKGHPRLGVGAQGGEGEHESGCRVRGIRPDSGRDLAQNQRHRRGREVWKTAIFVLGEKSKYKCPRSRDSGVLERKQKPGGQELAWEARAQWGHAGPLPSPVGAPWAGPGRPGMGVGLGEEAEGC